MTFPQAVPAGSGEQRGEPRPGSHRSRIGRWAGGPALAKALRLPSLVCLVTLAVSAVPSRADAGSMTCQAKRAGFAIGKTYTPALAEKARRKAGAAMVRPMRPGTVHTMEFRSDRLDIVLDKADVVRALHCG